MHDTAHQMTIADISRERYRQEHLKRSGRFTYTPDDTIPWPVSFAMLAEEAGEVAREVLALSGDVQEAPSPDRLRAELIHVAAIACAMAERLTVERLATDATGATDA